MISRRFFAAVLAFLLTAASFASHAQSASMGQWSRVNDLPINPIHNVVLPNGKIMMWARNYQQGLWDPATQAFTVLPNPGYDLFCAGHAYLADGRVLVPGGHIADFIGLAKASIYNPATNSWSPVPDMNAGRWYPTVTPLANGDALVVSGQIDWTAGVNPLPQVYEAATNTWRSLWNAQYNQGLYPMMYLLANGKVVDVGPSHVTKWLDTSGTGAWTYIGFRNFPWRDYGSSAMYADGKILVFGGADPPTAMAEVIDMNVPSPAWRTVASMSVARRHHNTTILPDGTLLVTGGTSAPGYNNPAGAVFHAELWNPATETWTTLASASLPRLYHSSAMLLPDGRVLTNGGDDMPGVEIFSPPYLFKGARPTVSGVPAAVGYGQRFTIQSPQAGDIGKVTMIRLGAVTHGFDQNQRINTLQFTRGSGTLDITTPANGNLAPPGHYMLFVVNSAGVPSVASLVHVSASASPPPPPPPPPSGPAPVLQSLSPASAAAGGPGFTLWVNGTGFASGATVLWNGSARSTSFFSSTHVRAAIPASDIAAGGTAQVSVANPGGTPSGALAFTITGGGGSPPPPPPPPPPSGPAPELQSISPTSAAAGGPGFTLWVNGTGFASGATVLWNGSARSTSFFSSTHVRAAIPASDIAAGGTAQVSVANPGGAPSGALPFTISGGGGGSPPPPPPPPPSGPVPELQSTAPTSATAGGPGFTLWVNGTGFASGATVLWNGAARSTSFFSSTHVRAAIPASDIAAAGTAQVSVVNPGGTPSGALRFTINSP